MKIRAGFVSNSSSSSFVIDRDCFSEKDLCRLKNLLSSDGKSIEHKYQYSNCVSGWTMAVDDCCVKFYTTMDNFNLEEYILDNFNVDEDDIE